VVVSALAVLVASALGAPASQSAEGLYLTWNDCPLGGGAQNMAFACNSNAGQQELYCAFTMPQAANNVTSIEIVIDVQHSAAQLPSWWQLSPGQCRGDITQFSLVAAADFPGRSACTNMWQGASTPAAANEPVFIPLEPRGAASQARIKVTAGVNPADAVNLDATSTYYAARVILKNNLTVGTPSCAGCDQAACLVMNSIRIAGPTGDIAFLQLPGSSGSNWALWQGGQGANCAAVPVRNRAWGQLKGLYR